MLTSFSPFDFVYNVECLWNHKSGHIDSEETSLKEMLALTDKSLRSQYKSKRKPHKVPLMSAKNRK